MTLMYIKIMFMCPSIRTRESKAPQLVVIVQRLVKSLHLALIANYCQLHDCEYQCRSHMIMHIPIVSVQTPCVQKALKKTAKAATFSTEVFEDTQQAY